MRLFNNKSNGLTTRQEHNAGRIADKILKAQRHTADYLNRKTALLSPKIWLMLLVIFCAAFGSYSLFLLIQAFY
ncbi:hypothetical protein ACVWYG_002217 [Pedobacter sp. UYEF25]